MNSMRMDFELVRMFPMLSECGRRRTLPEEGNTFHFLCHKAQGRWCRLGIDYPQ